MKAQLSITLLIGTLMWTGTAVAQSLKVVEKTNYYKIKGENAREFAQSMSKKGPYSRQHRTRAWATAARDISYQLVYNKEKKRCAITNAKVSLKITYTMPKLANPGKVSNKQKRNWQKMLGLLTKHERTHGLYYKQLASNVRRDLRRMKPASKCRDLVKRAKVIVEKLSAEDKKRNDRFDNRDRRNYRRMARIYRSS